MCELRNSGDEKNQTCTENKPLEQIQVNSFIGRRENWGPKGALTCTKATLTGSRVRTRTRVVLLQNWLLPSRNCATFVLKRSSLQFSKLSPGRSKIGQLKESSSMARKWAFSIILVPYILHKLRHCHMTQQSHCWAYTPRKPELKETRVPQCSSQHCL